MTGILRVHRRAALVAIAALVAAASLVSFAESYRGLFEWARHHSLTGVWAYAWPRQVDVFIAVGELALFVAIADRWTPRSRLAAWTVTLAAAWPLQVHPVPAPESAPASAPRISPHPSPRRSRPRTPSAPVSDTDAAPHYASQIAEKRMPSRGASALTCTSGAT